jgi:hypothetical protein
VSEPDRSAAHEHGLPAFRNAAHALVDGLADHLAALPSRPVWQPLPDALRRELLEIGHRGDLSLRTSGRTAVIEGRSAP